MHDIFWWFLHLTGADNLSGPYYGEWSGFLSDLGEIALIGAAWSIIRKHNCHVKGCWKLSRHQVGDYAVCSKHHPTAKTDPTHQDIIDHHAEINGK